MVGDPLNEVPTIGPIDPDQPELLARAAEPGKEETRPSGVGDGGCRDDHGQDAPKRIDQQVAFAAFDLFAAVVPTLPAQLRGFDALTIQAARGGGGVAALLLTHLGTQGVVETLPVPAVTPLVEIPVHALPLGIRMGEHTPFDAPIDNIEESIDHRTHIQRAMASTRLGWWDQICDKIPCGISEVCRV